jgi:prepilin-type N-terminal cleavage/methylation domain-containing protein
MASKNSGFTLVELVIAVALVALVTSALLLVFWSGITLWDRHQAESAALWNSTEAVRRIMADAGDAARCAVWARSGLSDALEVILPADTDADGNYVPVWDHKKLIYREGKRLIFYLSDATGAYNASGQILWRGTVSGASDPTPSNVAPDAQWSLYYNTTQGQVSGIESAAFATQTKGGLYWVVITVTAVAQQAAGPYRMTATGLVYLWNRVA